MSEAFYRQTAHVTEYVDVAIVGAGPAGLAAGAYFADKSRSFVVLDAGTELALRHRDNARSLVSGVGGAGLFSDGKFSFFPSATRLWQLESQERLHRAYAWFTNLLAHHNLDAPDLSLDGEQPEELATGGQLKRYPSKYLPFERRKGIAADLAALIGASLRVRHDVVGIRPMAEGYRLTVETPHGLVSIGARHVILATGRLGARDLARMLPDLPMVYRRHEVGVRIEQAANEFLFVNHGSLDVKLIVPASREGAEWRTFCTCRNGEVIQTAWRDCFSYSGRADGAATGRSNVGVNLRLSLPSGGPLEREMWDAVNGHLLPFKVSAAEYLASTSTYLGVELDSLFRSRLSTMLDETTRSYTTVYGPCIEGVGYYPDVNASLRINSQDIWMAGDAAGLFRGLSAAFLSGYYTAMTVEETSAATQALPSFVKHSPSQQMPVVFTAQSKVYFYCRDAVCEFALRAGYLPLNPFRVFEYFLGDRVDRDLVRQGNNQLVAVSDELWVFGPISDGVLFEIVRARQLRKPVRFFSIDTRADKIKAIEPSQVKFEPELHNFQITREDLVALLTDAMPRDKGDSGSTQLGLSFE